MSIYQVFVISRAGSLIYDWEAKSEMVRHVLLYLSLSFEIDIASFKFTVKILRYYVTSVNGFQVSGTRFFVDGKEHNVLLYLENKENYPVNLKFSPPTISTNEKIILSSMFHSLFTIAVQLSPVTKSSGIEMTIDNPTFLNKIPDQCGYIVFSKDEGIVKSDGDLANRDLAALIVEKILNLSRMDILPNTKFNQISVVFKEYFYTISQSGKYTFIVKRRLNA
uniref:Trafficking protein particle complex subunit n=1 Tax=Heterorhabditis bacteriophora TaxID=37862 RepID=A0A1I7XVR2_HETBA